MSGGGGKGGGSTSTVSIPPEVLARYNAVNARAEQTATQPFQQYSTDPNAFVAPLTDTQQSGIANTNAMAGAAQPWYQAAGQALASGVQQAQPYIAGATQNVGTAQQQGTAYNQAAANLYGGAMGAASPYMAGATNAVGQALGAGVPLTQQALAQGTGLTQQGLGQIGDVYGQAQGYNAAATGAYGAGAAGSAPLVQQAGQQYQAGLGMALPFTLAGAQDVNAQQIGGRQINQFMNPYMNTVIGGTLAPLQQQQAMDRAAQTGQAIQAGAFGGDRAAIAQAALRGQQDIATGNVVGNLLNQGYGQALGAAQQQQGVNLSAAQANRAAQAATGQQLYGQFTGTGQQQAALANQIYGMGTQGASTLANLGQQGYQQGMGSIGQQLAGAQQLYGMGSGAGQQLYGQYSGAGQQLGNLGQQLYGQQTGVAQGLGAIGQQQFGQGMTAAQQQAALANQVYGMGAQTAQNLGALGTGAQTAGLTGAQAQLAAGQQQQQTQQAGLTALYNQFLQQQSYPFQVTQFLANIAEGTGALSGSTTTTQQSGGFFSDERVKEDIEQIGETYDGQKIIKFRYKGEHGPKQIGLSAQDVEKHHPHAVGDYHGIKTVDYDEATKDAAHRGHFYQGGLASMGGAAINDNVRENFDIGGLAGADQSALLQQLMGRQAVNPYGAAGAAQGAAGLVPTQRNIMTSSMPNRNLMVAPTPQRQQSGLSQTTSAIKDLGGIGSRGVKDTKTGQYTGGSGLLGAAQGVKDWSSGDTTKSANATPSTTSDNTGKNYVSGSDGQPMSVDDMRKFEENRGGRIGYATDGSVDDDNMPPPQQEADIDKPKDVDLLKHQGKMTIPDDNPQAKLAVAQGGGGGGGGGGGLGSLLGGLGSLGMGFAKAAPYLGFTAAAFGGAIDGLAGAREHHAGNTGDGSGTVGKDTLAGYDDRDLAIRTIASESGFKDPDETAGIAAVVGNRLQSGKWGDDYKSVVTAKNQFEPWSNPDAPNYPLKIDPNSPRYKMAAEALGRYENEQYDPTGGATHFFAPAAQSALGRKAPNWGQGKLFGATSFHKPGDPDFEGNYDMYQPQTTAGLATKKTLQPLDTGALGAIQKIPGIGSLAKSEEQGGLSEQTKLALLGGLGGMLASPNRSLLGAIGSGITSGVDVYQGMGGLGVQQKQAETQARLGAANIDRINAGIRAGAIQKVGDVYVVHTANKGTMSLQEWQDRREKGEDIPFQGETSSAPYASPTSGQPTSAAPSGATGTGSPTAQGATPETTKPSLLGDSGRRALANDYTGMLGVGWKEQKAISDAKELEINNNAAIARKQNSMMTQLADKINQTPETGFLAGGALYDYKKYIAERANDAVRTIAGSDGKINGKPYQEYLINPDDLDKGTAVNKLAGLSALNLTSGAGQKANASLEDVRNWTPNMNIPRSAAIKLLAGNLAANRPAIELKNYMDEAKNELMQQHKYNRSGYLAQNLETAFQDDVDQRKYLRDQGALEQYLSAQHKGKPLFLLPRDQLPENYLERKFGSKDLDQYVRGN